MTEESHEKAMRWARGIGRNHGTDAARRHLQDTVGGRSPARGDHERARCLIKGIEKGDHAVLEDLPHPDLSGCGPNKYSLWDLLLATVEGLEEGDGDDETLFIAGEDEICGAYEVAFESAVKAETLAYCMSIVGKEKEV